MKVKEVVSVEAAVTVATALLSFTPQRFSGKGCFHSLYYSAVMVVRSTVLTFLSVPITSLP